MTGVQTCALPISEKYQDAQVAIRPVDKVNRTLDGLSIRVNEPGMNISPTIYVNHMYEDYVTTENLNATLERYQPGFDCRIVDIGKSNGIHPAFGKSLDGIFINLSFLTAN